MPEVRLILKSPSTCMFNKLLIYTALQLLITSSLISQHNCAYTIEVNVADRDSNIPVESASVIVNDTSFLSNSDGFIAIANACKGLNVITVQQLGYHPSKININTLSDTSINIQLIRLNEELQTIFVNQHSGKKSISEKEVISNEKIAFNAEKNFSQQLESISGVSLLKTGSEIAKPVIHGLYGNRLQILNNGIPQSGQQWGNDHSPEIDPLAAGSMSVIKGAASLEYSGNNPGAVILTEPLAIGKSKIVNGQATYFFESNGLGNGIHFQLKQNNPIVAWKIDGSLQKSGDRNSPDYFLNNTGSESANFSVQLQKQFSEKFNSSLYFSSFNSNTGILRGAHIGNLTDLQQAFSRETPFFTEEKFSYDIEAPRQAVNHHLLKWQSNYFFNERQWLQFKLAGQINFRREYDVRRNNSKKAPSLSLLQYNAFMSTTYQQTIEKNWKFKSGIQLNLTDNSNLPETGILPLIPDFLKLESVAFVSLSGEFKRLYVDVGIRYDNIVQEVLYISNTLPRKIIRDMRNFHNISSLAGIAYRIPDKFKLDYSIAYALRNPAINEMYSMGLHQGISGIEEGEMNLNTERGLKNSLGLEIKLKKTFTFNLNAYHHYFNNFIYLQVQSESRLTIRGAFPVYVYQQDDVQIYGFDAQTKIAPFKGFNIDIRYSFLRGNHLYDNKPLVYMPSNNFTGELSYTIPELNKNGKSKIKNLSFVLRNRYVFQQNNILPEQDFYAPPSSYFLMDFSLSADIPLKKAKLNFSLRIENMLNTRYRDYMNRQRYYADEQGINLIAVLHFKF